MDNNTLHTITLTTKELTLAVSALTTYAFECEEKHAKLAAAIDAIAAKMKDSPVQNLSLKITIPDSTNIAYYRELARRSVLQSNVKQQSAYAQKLVDMTIEDRRKAFKKAVARYRKAEDTDQDQKAQYWYNRIVDHFKGDTTSATRYLIKAEGDTLPG